MATLVGGDRADGSLTGDVGTPSAGDNIVLREGAASFTSNLDLTVGGTIEIDTFIAVPSFTGTIGAAGTSMQVDLSGTSTLDGIFEWNSPGDFVYVAAAPIIARAVIYQTGTRGVFFTGGEVTVCELGGGLADFNSSCDVVTLNVSGGTARVRTHATQALDTLNMYGGTVSVQRDLGTAVVYNGVLNITDSSVTPTSVTVGPRGRFSHIGGNITTLIGLPGSTIDLSGLSESITITNATRWPGCTYIPPAQGVTVTVSTPTEILNGGTFAT